MSQYTTKPTARLVWPGKTQISLCIHAVWSESSMISCVFYSLGAIQRGIQENLCNTGWMYRLIWVFAGHTGLIVDFVVPWLKFQFFIINYCYLKPKILVPWSLRSWELTLYDSQHEKMLCWTCAPSKDWPDCSSSLSDQSLGWCVFFTTSNLIFNT